jgi:hypothetical protein
VIGLVQSIFGPHSLDSFDGLHSTLESSSKGIRAVKISLAALMVTALAQGVLVVITGSAPTPSTTSATP